MDRFKFDVEGFEITPRQEYIQQTENELSKATNLYRQTVIQAKWKTGECVLGKCVQGE